MTTSRPTLVTKTIHLKTEYDYASRVKLMEYFKYFCRSAKIENNGDASVEFIHKKIVDKILDYQSKNQSILEPTDGRWIEFDSSRLSSKTIGNLMNAKPSRFMNIHLNTFRFLDAHTQVCNVHSYALPTGPNFLSNLGKNLALFHFSSSFADKNLNLQMYEGVYLAENIQIFVPGPRDLNSIAINLLSSGSDDGYLYCYVVTFPRSLNVIDFDHIHKISYGCETFSGVAVRTNDGIICNLSSENTFIPLICFVLECENKKITSIKFSPVGFESQGYLREYIDIERTQNQIATKLFDNILSSL